MFSGSIEGRLFPVPNKSLSALVKGCERVAAVHDHYGDGFFTLLIISTIFAVVYYVWAIANMISVSRSYLYVYDDHIEGVTTMGLTSSNVSFSLTYDQISQVETAKKQIIIYTSFTKYTVMAMNNQYHAQEEIRKRISAKN